MVGQYHGPQGAAAMAVVAPVWNIIYSLGLLAGIGGSVLFSTARGQGQSRQEREYFSAALLGVSGLAIISWLVIFLLDAPLLTLFGADQALLPLAQAYLLPVKWVVPVFLFNQMLAAFLRNDGDPGRAAAAVLSGGIFNIFGDYFFVFVLDMGIFGAGLATAIGSVISLLVEVMLLSVLLFQDRFNGMIACKNTLAGTKDYHVVFGEESYTVVTEVTTSTFRYELIDAMAESQDYIILLMKKRYAQPLDKRTLTGGTVEEFKRFLEEKTGKTFRHVK